MGPQAHWLDRRALFVWPDTPMINCRKRKHKQRLSYEDEMREQQKPRCRLSHRTRRMKFYPLFNFVWLLNLGRFAFAQQNHFGFCFSRLKEADSDGDQMLSEMEYASFVSLFSAGAIVEPVPDSVFEPFTAMANNDAKIAIDGVSSSLGSEAASFVMRLCHAVKSSFMTHFDVSIVFDSCLGALKTADTIAPSGYLEPDTEFVQFMIVIASDTLGDVSSYDDLPTLVKYAFLDMAIDGMIAGPEGGAYLQEFCDRTVLASKMEAAAAAMARTLSPSLAPVELKREPSDDSGQRTTVKASAAPKANVELTNEMFNSCLRDLMLSDINRNDLLERSEFGRLTDLLHYEVFGSNIDQKTEPIVDEAYKEILSNQSKRVSASVAGSKPGRKPTRKEKNMLEFVCKTAHVAIRNANAADSSQVIDVESSREEVKGDDFDRFFQTCKISMFASDMDKDSSLDQEEFAKVISRLAKIEEHDYRTMDDSFKMCFREVSKGGSIDVSGTSPIAVVSILQDARLQSTCRKIDEAIETFRRENDSGPGNSIGTGDLLVRNNDLQNEFPGLSEDFFRLCTMAMYIADDNRDEAVSRSEFVTFVGRLTFDKNGNEVYEDLDELFRVTFEGLSGATGLIDVHGARPGYHRNYDQEKSLRHVCHSLSEAIVAVDASGVEEATDLSNTIERNYDDDYNHEEEEEYRQPDPAHGATPVALVPHADNNKVSSLDDMEEVADGQSQSKPSEVKPKPAPETSFKLNNKTFTSPNEVSFSQFSRCQAKISKADTDGDSLLNQDEYLDLLNFLGKKSIKASSFAALSITLQAPFLTLAVDQPSVGVYGTHVGEKPNNLNVERLKRFCTDIFDALFLHTMEDSVDLDCLSSMKVADYNEDRILDHEEFVSFLNVWTKGRFQGLSFSALPFEMRAQFNWGSTFDGVFNIQGSSLIGELERDVDSLGEFCRRAKSTFQSLKPPSTLTEHCQLALESSDSNQDGMVNKKEYISFVSVFTNKLWEPPKRFQKLEQEIKDFFKANVGQTDSLELQLDMANFCSDFESAVTLANHKKVLDSQCRISLLSGDTDANGSLSSDEFSGVLIDLCFKGNQLGKVHSYGLDNFGASVQRYFGTIARGNDEFDLSAFKYLDATNQDDDVASICSELFDNVIKDLKSSFVPVYNAFLIAAENATEGTALESDYMQVVMERAYARFASGRFGHRRRLFEVVGVTPYSAHVDSIEAVDCPPSLVNQISLCAVVYAHFNAILFGDVDKQALSADLSNDYQAMIDSGEMQKQILSVDPQFSTKVLRSSFPLKPGDYSDTSTQESILLESGTVMMMMFSVTNALVFVVIGFYYGRHLAIRQQVDVEMSQTSGDKLIDFSDKQDNCLLSEEERRAKEDYWALREYMVPLLISEAYVSSCHSHLLPAPDTSFSMRSIYQVIPMERIFFNIFIIDIRSLVYSGDTHFIRSAQKSGLSACWGLFALGLQYAT